MLLALIWQVVMFNVGAGGGGMPPPVPAVPAHPRPSSPACSIKVPEPEPADLTSLARITADKAMAAAQAAYPGSRVRALVLENDNGCLVYGVLLSNGLEVKIDAGNGLVLRWEGEDDGDDSEYEIK